MQTLRGGPGTLTLPLTLLLLLGACGGEPTPRSVADFLDDPALLDAVLSRCSGMPAGEADEPDCVTARRAAQQLEEEAGRRERPRVQPRARNGERDDSRAEPGQRQRPRSAPDASGDGPRALPDGSRPPPLELESPPDARARPDEPGATLGTPGDASD